MLWSESLRQYIIIQSSTFELGNFRAQDTSSGCVKYLSMCELATRSKRMHEIHFIIALFNVLNSHAKCYSTSPGSVAFCIFHFCTGEDGNLVGASFLVLLVNLFTRWHIWLERFQIVLSGWTNREMCDDSSTERSRMVKLRGIKRVKYN